MGQSSIKMKNRVLREKIENFFDKRDFFFKCLLDFETENKFIPKKYLEDKRSMISYNEYKITGGWKNNPRVLKYVNKAIKKLRKNIDKKYKGETSEPN